MVARYLLNLMLWLPVLFPVLFGLLGIIGDQHIVKVVALVHGPDFHSHSTNGAEVLQRLLVLEVVWVSNLPWLPNTLPYTRTTSADAVCRASPRTSNQHHVVKHKHHQRLAGYKQPIQKRHKVPAKVNASAICLIRQEHG